MSTVGGLTPERGWAGGVLAILAALLGGVAFFPDLVWNRFLWHYLWGPVYADAHNANCAVLEGGSPRLVNSVAECGALQSGGRIVAEPGYTLVSEAVYAVTLIVAIVGVLFLLRRLDIGNDRSFLYGLLPFMFFGGALRVVEDVLDNAPAGASFTIEYPWNTLFISPLIYFTVFAVALAALGLSLWLVRRGDVDSYEYGLAAIGSIALALPILYLLVLWLTSDQVGFYPQIAIIVLAGAGAITLGTWRAIETYKPGLNAGTGYAGLAVLFAHSVDGVANVVGIDWGAELGLPYGDLVPKHPINDAMIGVGTWLSEIVAGLTGGMLVPAEIIGTAWPFLLLKIAAAVGVIWLFDERIFEESPRYAVLLLVAIVAVGLGPGTRDMLRATFGV